jgi:hypothetical protein
MMEAIKNGWSVVVPTEGYAKTLRSQYGYPYVYAIERYKDEMRGNARREAPVVVDEIGWVLSNLLGKAPVTVTTTSTEGDQVIDYIIKREEEERV